MRISAFTACAVLLAVTSAHAEPITTPSGIVFESLRAGSGESPKATDKVRVHYRGTFPDGREFDSSYKSGEPAEFPLQDVIAGWREGIQLLTEGERARLWIPENLAYKGQQGKPRGTLVFDVELLKIK